MKKYQIYTDGASSNNGYDNAIGGWAFIIIDENNNMIYSQNGKVLGATNQQMELTAITRACAYMRVYSKEEKVECRIYSDSAYAINCYKQEWWKKWEQNSWLNSKKEPVANQELWRQLIPFFKDKNFQFEKVKGHDKVDTISSQWNDYADKLAVEGRLS